MRIRVEVFEQRDFSQCCHRNAIACEGNSDFFQSHITSTAVTGPVHDAVGSCNQKHKEIAVNLLKTAMFFVISRSRVDFCTSQFSLFFAGASSRLPFDRFNDQNSRNVYVVKQEHSMSYTLSFSILFFWCKMKQRNVRKTFARFLLCRTLNSPFPITSKSLKSPKSSIVCRPQLFSRIFRLETLKNFNFIP